MRRCLSATRVLPPDLVYELQDATHGRCNWVGLTQPRTPGRKLNSSASRLPEALRLKVRRYLDVTGYRNSTVRLWIPGTLRQRRRWIVDKAIELVRRGHPHRIVGAALGRKRRQVATWAASIHGPGRRRRHQRLCYDHDVMPRGLASLLRDRRVGLNIGVAEGLEALRHIFGINDVEARRLALLRGLEITVVGARC